MVKVHLRNRIGYGRPRRYYGPGICEVPEDVARALGLSADEPQEGGAGDTAPPITLYEGFPPDMAERLGARYPDRDALAAASDQEILGIDGVGPATLKKLRAL